MKTISRQRGYFHNSLYIVVWLRCLYVCFCERLLAFLAVPHRRELWTSVRRRRELWTSVDVSSCFSLYLVVASFERLWTSARVFRCSLSSRLLNVCPSSLRALNVCERQLAFLAVPRRRDFWTSVHRRRKLWTSVDVGLCFFLCVVSRALNDCDRQLAFLAVSRCHKLSTCVDVSSRFSVFVIVASLEHLCERRVRFRYIHCVKNGRTLSYCVFCIGEWLGTNFSQNVTWSY